MTPSRPPPLRVLITGIGLASSLGRTREETWRAVCAGGRGLRRLELPKPMPGDPPWSGGPQRSTSLDGLARRAAAEAWHDSGRALRLPEGTADGRTAADDWPADDGVDPERVAVVFGLSKGNPSLLGRMVDGVSRFGPARPTARNWLTTWPDHGASLLSHAFGFGGPSLAPVAACATGLIAALRAAELVREGVADVALAGAADQSLTGFLLAAFRRMGVLTRVGEGDDPARAVRPWDRNRSGFLVGEGAAVLVLEREDRARARGALPYCEFAGGAFGSDAYHLTALNPDPSHLAGLIVRALEWSGVGAGEVDHVNVHGTATRDNDPLECRAIRRALGPHADGVSCSANKAQVGHCLGAAGAVELALTGLAVRDQFVPPTLNLDDPDPSCDLDGTPHVGRARSVRAALKLSLGFGGHLAAAVLRQADGPRRAPVIRAGGGPP